MEIDSDSDMNSTPESIKTAANEIVNNFLPQKSGRIFKRESPRGTEYFNRYKRGMLCYLRDEIVVGFVFWNMPPIEDRKQVCTELLRAKPSYLEIDTLAELLGFPGTKCVYKPADRNKPEDHIEDLGSCIAKFKTW